MKLHVGDIIVRSSTAGDTIWFSERLVIQVCGISEKQLRTKYRYQYKHSVQTCYHHNNIMPDTGKNWRYTKINGRYYYDYNRVSNREPNYYKDRFGNIEDIINRYNAQMAYDYKNTFETELKTYLNNHFKEFLHCYPYPHTKTQSIALAKACAALEFVITYRNDNSDVKITTIAKDISIIIAKENYSYLPTNYRILLQKIERYDQGEAIADIVQLPRAGNNYAVKYEADNEVRSWAMQLRSMGQNYSNESIIRKVEHMCIMTGKDMPSRRWFGSNIFELHNTKFLTAVNRYGSGERNAKLYEGYIPVENALFAGDCWQIDATRINLIAHKTAEGTKDFLFIIAVRDVHSGDIIGYNFDYKEDRWSVIQALKMAVKATGYLPYELVFDRFPGHNTEEVKRMLDQVEQLGVKTTFAYKATGKASLERWFGTMQDVFADSSEYYYGQGIRSTRAHAHRSPDYIADITKKANNKKFGLAEAVEEAQYIVEAYRSTPLSYYSRKHNQVNKSPKLLHSESDKPHVKQVNDVQISMLFGYKKKLQLKHTGLIVTEIFKTEYIYQVSDYQIISNYPEVIISYELEDLSSVFLFTAKNHFLIHLGSAQLYNRPQIYGPQAEFNRIAKEKERIAKINALREAELSEKTGKADEVQLMLGRKTKKDVAEETETIRLLNEANNSEKVKPMKKAVGSDTNSPDIDLRSLILNQY